MNEPTYKIHGVERKRIKKELSELKRFVKDFWYYHQLDKDMSCIDTHLENIGLQEEDGYPMSDKKAQEMFNEANDKIKEIEEKLNVLY